MKKKIFITLALVFVMVIALAFSVGAADKIIKLSTCPTLAEIHANRDAYVSHLDALEEESTYKTTDPDSVVVLSDLAEAPTYYVYPAYYLIRSSYYNIAGGYKKLNEAIVAADSTAFAGYYSPGGQWENGRCDQLIRVEVPKYVTQIHGQYKFESSSNLVEVYFPTREVIDEETGLKKTVTYVTSVSGENLFGSCGKLQYIHNMGYLPIGIVQGNNAGFTGCYALKEIIIPDGVTSIPNYMFKNCQAVKEIVLPNSVTYMGKQAFAYCTSLEKFSFGASFCDFGSPNNDYETFSGTDSLKFVYMPATIINDLVNYTGTSLNNQFKNIFSNSSKAVIFLVGDADDAALIKEKFAATNANGNIANADTAAYDADVDYVTLQAGLKKSVIVYNYSPCDAFYNGEHTESTTTYSFAGEQYTTPYCSYTGCTRAGCSEVDVVQIAGALFENKGYSKVEDGTSFTYGIIINEKNIADYKAKTGEEITYGFIVGAVPNEPTGDIISAEGESLLEKTVVADFTTLAVKNLTIYNVKMVGIDTDLQKAQLIYCCAYVIDGDSISYIGEKVTEKAVSISSDAILVIETTTPPTTDENN